MISMQPDSWKSSLAIASVIASAYGTPALAQAAPPVSSVIGYSGAFAFVQDPPGSRWRSVASASLPNPTPVLLYQLNEWVKISSHGRPIRISVLSVYLNEYIIVPNNGSVGQPSVVTAGEGNMLVTPKLGN